MLRRREFLASLAAPLLPAADTEPIIDIHQHTNYSGRSDAELIAHQRRDGREQDHPAARRLEVRSGRAGRRQRHRGRCWPNSLPKEYVFFANELPDIPEARAVLEKYLKMGAIGIGEQKFPVEADSKSIDLIAEIAQEHSVPVLLHFEYQALQPRLREFPSASWSVIPR